MLIAAIVALQCALIAVGFYCVRWVPKWCCIVVIRNGATLRLTDGLNFLIPFIDKVVCSVCFKEENVLMCSFNDEDGEQFYLYGGFEAIDKDAVGPEFKETISDDLPKESAEGIKKALKTLGADLASGPKERAEVARKAQEFAQEVMKSKNVRLSGFRIVTEKDSDKRDPF